MHDLLGNFFSNQIFNIIGGITMILSFLFTIISLLIKFFSWTYNITPIIFKLGYSLWKRKIAIFESGNSIETTIIDSKIFNKKRIIHIPSDNLLKAHDCSIFIIEWESFGDRIDEIFNMRKNPETPIIVFSKPGGIEPREKMADIANRANTVVVNFRGRLLNDILTSLITTSYVK